MSDNKRNSIIDSLKSVAVMCVILGHAIQYSDISQISVFSRILYRAIYSFHMPLFAMISGYLVVMTKVGKTVGGYILKRSLIIIPIIVYSILPFFVERVYRKDESIILNLRHFLGFAFWGNGYVWFLRIIMIVTILLGVIIRCNVKRRILWISMMLTFLLPKDYFLSQFAYIYFFAALGAVFYSVDTELVMKKSVCIFNAVCFFCMLCFYKEEFFIYNGRWGLINDIVPIHILGIDFFRILIGISGCFFVWSMCRMISINPLYGIAKDSLGFYCISNLVAVFICALIDIFHPVLKFVIIFLISSVVSVVLVFLFNKNKITRFIFLGHK